MHEGKKERGKETVPKGACNYSQGCIAEVEREGPWDDHEGGKRTALCARRYVETEKRRETRWCTCTSACKCKGAACVIQRKRETGRPRLRTKAQGRVSSVTEASPLGLLLLGSNSPPLGSNPLPFPSLLGVPPSISFSSSLVSISYASRKRPPLPRCAARTA